MYTKEHPGRTRGTGNVPWAVAFQEHLGTYRSRGRRNAQREAEWHSLLQAVREEVNATNEKFRAELVESLGRHASTVSGGVAPVVASPPGLVQRSCGSTALPEEDIGVTFPVDKITQPTPCKLYIHQKFFDTKVAVGQAWPTSKEVMLHNSPLPEGYAKVTIDTLAKSKYRNVDLDFPTDDNKLLGDNIGSFVAWRKRYVIFESESESSDHDPRESPERGLPTPPMSERESSPPPQMEQIPPSTPSEREQTPLSPRKKRRSSSITTSYHLQSGIQNLQ
ncbi:transposon protein, putative, CACTA, En/Spm sub-class [Panicum miliaceum]|uniref:Transposon protein, putative, CACTA, En/Spm sub-class n=1 Tax=Panicum miliaceum TaxID=4540 RepID=A0A3L6SL43_PANMI|nr:transposon protein, putative, CACTA, En/Spm sub-class [Panicum miliaceum]